MGIISKAGRENFKWVPRDHRFTLPSSKFLKILNFEKNSISFQND